MDLNWLNERIKGLWKDRMLLRAELLRKPWTWPIVRYWTRALPVLWLVRSKRCIPRTAAWFKSESTRSSTKLRRHLARTEFWHQLQYRRPILTNVCQFVPDSDSKADRYLGLLVLREAVMRAGKKKKPEAHQQVAGYIWLEINHYDVCPHYSYYLSIFRRRRSLLELVDTCHCHNSIEDIRIIERSVLSRDDLDGFLRCNTSNDRCDSVNFSIRIACQLLTNGQRIFLH